MNRDEAEEYQQIEIDNARDAITNRIDEISGRHGLLEGEHMDDRQNKRLQAYLEGYADALDYAELEVRDIQNMVQYVSSIEDGDPE